MKLLALLTLSRLSHAACSQAPKNAYKITATDTLSLDANFKLVMNALIEMGYEVANTEREFGLITTGTKQIPKMGGVYYLSIVAKDKKVLITGQLRMNGGIAVGGIITTDDFSPIYNGGLKGSGLRRSFEEMEKVARSISPSITYDIKP